MEIFHELNYNKGLSLAFGFFDGVHRGHQEVVKSAVDFAKQNSTKSAVITFQDHPCCFFYNLQPRYILKKEDKIALLKDLGIDYLYFLKFDENIAQMMASEYLKDVIMKHFEPNAISTGFNHYFGAQKTGNVKYLNEMQQELRYQYVEVPPKLFHDEVISSTRIREDISLGRIELVNKMLGHDYFLEEIVTRGQQIGRTIGFKTANLFYPEDLVEVSRGVYKVTVDYDGKTYKGIANYGLRPTVAKEEKPALEVHILDFDKEIYGEKIKVNFIKKLRSEMKFASLYELKEQIKRDIEHSLQEEN